MVVQGLMEEAPWSWDVIPSYIRVLAQKGQPLFPEGLSREWSSSLPHSVEPAVHRGLDRTEPATQWRK